MSRVAPRGRVAAPAGVRAFCTGCLFRKPNAAFSKEEMKRPDNERRCKQCCREGIHEGEGPLSQEALDLMQNIADREEGLDRPRDGALKFDYPLSLPPMLSDREDVCPICLASLWPGALAAIPCSHRFHSACLEQHTKRQIDDINEGKRPGDAHAGCPLCGLALADPWSSVYYATRWHYPDHWIAQIDCVLISHWHDRPTAPTAGVPVERVIDRVLQDARDGRFVPTDQFDRELPQLRASAMEGLMKARHIGRSITNAEGFLQEWSGRAEYALVSDDRQQLLVWPHSWGPPPGTRCSNPNCHKAVDHDPNKCTVCHYCKDFDLVYYCSERCRGQHEPAHNCYTKYGWDSRR